MFRIYASLITLVFTLACSPKNDEKKITVSNSEALDSPRSSESKELPSTMIKYHKYEKIKISNPLYPSEKDEKKKDSAKSRKFPPYDFPMATDHMRKNPREESMLGKGSLGYEIMQRKP